MSSLPTYDELMLPLLQLAEEDGQEHSVSELRNRVAHTLQLTPEQRAIKLPSGRQATYDNRAGWATTHLRKAKLLESTRRGYVRITPRGRAVVADNPSAINDTYLLRFEEYQEFSDRATPASVEKQIVDISGGTAIDISSGATKSTPDERIREAYATIEANLRDDILDKAQKMDSSAFEWLVLQLLHAMGYGGSIEDVEGVPRGPDGGIDGLIKEDKLGLETIYIQAKCWQTGDNVGRKEIQAFAGALAGVGARKGVFITTSGFTKNADTYAQKLVNSKIVLIDGQKLAQLMIKHDVGVSIHETFCIKRIDEDFFTEAEL
ncbi:MAG: restriction endonuclease [Phormidesmis sp.]